MLVTGTLNKGTFIMEKAKFEVGKTYYAHSAWGTKGSCIPKQNGPFPGCFEYHVCQTDKFHIAGKPTPLMEELVEIVPEGGIVLDPFVGSGTTCLAAKRRGRRYIGIEKMEEYYKIAQRRIANG